MSPTDCLDCGRTLRASTLIGFEAGREATLPPFAYFPFGGGPCQCIGNSFAMMAITLVVAIIAQHFRLDLVPGQRPGLAPAITLRPDRPIRAVLRKRERSGNDR